MMGEGGMKRTGLVLAVIGFISFYFAEARGEEWELYAMTVEGSWFYDVTGITRPSKDIVRVQVKVIYTDIGKMSFAKELEEKFMTVSFALVLGEIHCVDKKVRVLSRFIYSTNGDILGSFNNENPTWSFIAPGSKTGGLFKSVCK